MPGQGRAAGAALRAQTEASELPSGVTLGPPAAIATGLRAPQGRGSGLGAELPVNEDGSEPGPAPLLA